VKSFAAQPKAIQHFERRLAQRAGGFNPAPFILRKSGMPVVLTYHLNLLDKSWSSRPDSDTGGKKMKSKGKEFYDSKIPELVKLYKGGATIAELKKKWHCNGNPLVARLKAEGVYKEPGKKAAKSKAARKQRALIGNRVTVYEPGKAPKAARKRAEKAATGPKPPAKANITRATKQQAKSAFTPEREARIAEIIQERGCTRKAAIQQLWNEEAIREADAKAQPQAESALLPLAVNNLPARHQNSGKCRLRLVGQVIRKSAQISPACRGFLA